MTRPRRPWLRRVLLLLGVLGVVWVIVFVVWWTGERREGENRRAKAVAELDDADPGWRTIDLEAAHNKAVAPPDRNAGECALAALALLPTEYTEFDRNSDYRSDLILPHLPSPDDLRVVRSALKASAPAVQKLRGVRQFSGGGFRLKFQEPDLIGTLLDQSQKMRGAANLLTHEAALTAADDRGDESLDVALCVLHLDRAVGDEPISISLLIRVAVLAVSARSVERTLAWTATATEPKLAEVQAELLRTATLPRLKVALRAERAIQFRLLENMENGTLDPNAIAAVGTSPPDRFYHMLSKRHWPGQQADALSLLTRLVAVADMPTEQRGDAMADLDRAADALLPDATKRPMSILLGLVFPALTRVVEADTRTIGLLRSTAAAVACERFRLKHGRLPNTLAEIPKGILNEIPADPYTGKPVLYKRTDDGAVVYCTGADQTDDGGKLKPGSEKGFDLGIQLFDAAHRRKPPLPKPPAEAKEPE